ncbi:MAG: hypothetical protein AAF870_02615 [Pseudomonadota bacterium]
MTFHSDALNGGNDKVEQTRLTAALKSGVAVAATIGFLVLVQPSLTVLFGAAAVTSLSLTMVSLLQTKDNWAKSTPKLDAIYGVLIGMMAIISFGLAGNSVVLGVGLLFAMIVGEVAVSAIIGAGFASLKGMYSAPLGIALNLHSRLFGLLGRAV